MLLSAVLILATTPTPRHDATHEKPANAAIERQAIPGEAFAASPEASIAAVLDRGAQIGNPFPLKNAVKWMPTDRNAAKATSIHRLAAVARQRGLDQSVDLKRTVASFEEMLLAEKLMQSLADTIVIEEKEIRSEFDRRPERYDEFELSHIFVPFYVGKEPAGADERAAAQRKALALASEIEAKLKAGGDFAAIAQAQSQDRESAQDGGRLPVILGTNVPRFMAAIQSLKDGEVSKIVDGGEGYHLILLDRRRHLYSGPARDLIEREMRNARMVRLLPEIAEMESAGK